MTISLGYPWRIRQKTNNKALGGVQWVNGAGVLEVWTVEVGPRRGVVCSGLEARENSARAVSRCTRHQTSIASPHDSPYSLFLLLFQVGLTKKPHHIKG